MNKIFLFAHFLFIPQLIHSMQAPAPNQDPAYPALAAVNRNFALIKDQEIVYMPETQELLCVPDNIFDLRQYSTAIYDGLGVVNQRIRERLPAHAVDTKNRLTLAITLLFERARKSTAKAQRNIAQAPVATLSPFFAHIGKANRRKCRTCAALTYIDPTQCDLIEQICEGGKHALPAIACPAGVVTDIKNLADSLLNAGAKWIRDYNDTDLSEYKDTALLRIIAAYGAADRPTPITAATLADTSQTICTLTHQAWPIIKEILTRAQGLDPRQFKDILLLPIQAPKTTFIARMAAPWVDTTPGHWLLEKFSQSPALAAAGSVYINGIRALRTLLATEHRCTPEEFDEQFTQFITHYVVTQEMADQLAPSSIARLCNTGDEIMHHAPACSQALETFATHARQTKAETDSFLNFLKTIGQQGAHEAALFQVPS